MAQSSSELLAYYDLVKTQTRQLAARLLDLGRPAYLRVVRGSLRTVERISEIEGVLFNLKIDPDNESQRDLLTYLMFGESIPAVTKTELYRVADTAARASVLSLEIHGTAENLKQDPEHEGTLGVLNAQMEDLADLAAYLETSRIGIQNRLDDGYAELNTSLYDALTSLVIAIANSAAKYSEMVAAKQSFDSIGSIESLSSLQVSSIEAKNLYLVVEAHAASAHDLTTRSPTTYWSLERLVRDLDGAGFVRDWNRIYILSVEFEAALMEYREAADSEVTKSEIQAMETAVTTARDNVHGDVPPLVVFIENGSIAFDAMVEAKADFEAATTEEQQAALDVFSSAASSTKSQYTAAEAQAQSALLKMGSPPVGLGGSELNLDTPDELDPDYYGSGGGGEDPVGGEDPAIGEGSMAEALVDTDSALETSHNDFMEQVIEAADLELDFTRQITLQPDYSVTNADYAPYLNGNPLDKEVSFRLGLPPTLLDAFFVAEVARSFVLIYEEAVESIKFYRQTLLDRQKMLNSIPDDETRFMYSADTWHELEGVVRTVEVPDEIQQRGIDKILIYPGYWTDAAYSQQRDGQLHARESQHANQVFFNAAILPGMQRWYPQFRFATIMGEPDKIEHTAEIQYDSMDSSAQGLLITDPAAKRLDVPIHYMECNSHIFEPGDRVLVELEERDWQKPEIIGYRKEPKHCPIFMAYGLSWRATTEQYIDPCGTDYPPLPPESDLHRDGGVSRFDMILFAGEAFFVFFTRDLQAVIDATLISEWPDTYTGTGYLVLDEIGPLAGMDIPTDKHYYCWNEQTQEYDLELDVPWVGTEQIAPDQVYPISKPPDPFEYVYDEEDLDEENIIGIKVQFRQYKNDDFQMYNVDGVNKFMWSNSIDPDQMIAEVEVEVSIDQMPPTLYFMGLEYRAKRFVSFTQFDFQNGRPAQSEWMLDQMIVEYEVVEN